MKRKYALRTLPLDKHPGWRAYQDTLKRNVHKHRFRQRFPLWVLFALVISAVVCVCYSVSMIVMRPETISAKHIDPNEGIATKNQTISSTTNTIDKQTIRRMLADIGPRRMFAETITLENGGTRYQIETTIDGELQNILVDKLRLEHARYLGLVVLNPATGHILSMISQTDTTRTAIHAWTTASRLRAFLKSSRLQLPSKPSTWVRTQR